MEKHNFTRRQALQATAVLGTILRLQLPRTRANQFGKATMGGMKM